MAGVAEQRRRPHTQHARRQPPPPRARVGRRRRLRLPRTLPHHTHPSSRQQRQPARNTSGIEGCDRSARAAAERAQPPHRAAARLDTVTASANIERSTAAHLAPDDRCPGSCTPGGRRLSETALFPVTDPAVGRGQGSRPAVSGRGWTLPPSARTKLASAGSAVANAQSVDSAAPAAMQSARLTAIRSRW